MKHKETFGKAYFQGEDFNYDENTSFFIPVNWKDIAQSLKDVYKRNTGNNLSHFIDFGCATGYLVKEMTALGTKSVGYDISEWAVENKVTPEIHLFNVLSMPLDYFILEPIDMLHCFGVLHYFTEKQIGKVLNNLVSVKPETVFIGQLPLDSPIFAKKYLKDWMEKDEHTKLVKSLDWWIIQMHKRGYVLKECEVANDYVVWIYFQKIPA
jgi:SAM-dependent methyltransferase